MLISNASRIGLRLSLWASHTPLVRFRLVKFGPRMQSQSIKKPIGLSLCCMFVGYTSKQTQTHFPKFCLLRAACQDAVIPVVDVTADPQSVKSFQATFIRQLSLWHHVFRTLASNFVQFMLVSFRFIRNSILFGPLLVCYPIVYFFPERFQNVWLRALLHSVELSGPTFIKLGQWASTRRDLFAEDFCDGFSKLHRNAPSHSMEYTVLALERAFGLLWKELFRFENSDERVGVQDSASAVYSGCVGQVHKAYMRPDAFEAVMNGREEGLSDWAKEEVSIQGLSEHQESAKKEWVPVAVKVLHPGIYENVHLDLRIIHTFARILNLIPGLHWLSPVDFVDEFEAIMKNQIDLKLEAANLDRFYQNFSEVSNVSVPRPVWPFVTHNVLVETFESGQSIAQFISGESEDPASLKIKKDLAQMGVDILLKMVFVDNFVHADLHPGNILVRGVDQALAQPSRTVEILDHGDEFQVRLQRSKSPLKLVLLDTGITSQLEDRDFSNFYQVFTAIVLCKGDVVAELFVEHATSNDCEDLEKFKLDMSELVKKAQALQLAKVQVGQLFRDLFSLMIHHKVKLESNFASIILAIMVLEGLGRSLNPNLDILEAAKPVLLGR